MIFNREELEWIYLVIREGGGLICGVGVLSQIRVRQSLVWTKSTRWDNIFKESTGLYYGKHDMCTMWWSRRSRGCWCWFACSAVILLSVSNSSIFSSRSIAAKSIFQEKIILEGFVVYSERGVRGMVFYIHKNIFLVHTSHIFNFSNCLVFHRFISISDLSHVRIVLVFLKTHQVDWPP